jgi:WD40 repeat protein
VLAPTETVTSLEFLGDGGDLVAIGTGSGEFGVWRRSTGSWLWKRPLTDSVLAYARGARDGKTVGFVSKNMVQFADAETGHVKVVDTVRSQAADVCFGPDSDVAALTTLSGEVRVYNLALGELQWTYFGHAAGAKSCVIPDRHTLLTASADGSIKQWNLDVRNESASHEGLEPTLFTEGTLPGEVVVATTDAVWAVAPNSPPEKVFTVAVDGGTVSLLASSAAGVVVGRGSWVTVIQRTAPERAVLTGHWVLPAEPTELELSPDGTTVMAMMDAAGPIVLRDSRRGDVLSTANSSKGALNSMRADSSRHLWVCSQTGWLSEFDFTEPNGREVSVSKIHRSPCWVTQDGPLVRTFSLDGTTVTQRSPQPKLKSGTAVYAGSGAVDVVLLSDGTVVDFEGPLELGRIQSRARGLQPIIVGSTLWYPDRRGRLARLDGPVALSPGQISTLWDERGTSKVEAGVLRPR